MSGPPPNDPTLGLRRQQRISTPSRRANVILFVIDSLRSRNMSAYGYQRPTTGTVELRGRDVTGLTTERRAREGVIRSFQGARLFPRLTVAENVEVACVAQGMSRHAARHHRQWR